MARDSGPAPELLECRPLSDATAGRAGRLRTPEMRLALVSFLILYLELALIRWLSGYVANFGYYANAVVLAAFLGIGLGCVAFRRHALPDLAPPLLLALVAYVARVQPEIVLGPDASSVFWAEAGRDRAGLTPARALPIAFAVLTALFAGLAQPLGAAFATLPRLRAYAFNIAGSLAGIAAFAAGSLVGAPPVVWFAVAGLVFLVAVPRPAGRRWVHAAAFLAVAGIAGWTSRDETWGPYYREQVVENRDPSGLVTHWLVGNGTPGIEIGPLGKAGSPFLYEVPYRPEILSRSAGPRYGRVLVIGCGGGNEVALALARGASHVDAVDINPSVIEIGRRLHPDRPFQSPKVRAVVRDGRTFVRWSRDSYDLVVYGLPDSTFSADRTSLRVESFLFTLEAFRDVRRRLSPDGVFVVYNYFRVPWLVEKVAMMMGEAFEQEPVVFAERGANWPAAVAVGPGVLRQARVSPRHPAPATDDWPFLYLRSRTVPRAYTEALAWIALVAAAALALVLRTEAGGERRPLDAARRLSYAALFCMGAAFMLLETRSLATFGLFFGTTWWTTALVFAAIHVSILAAVSVASAFPAIRPGAAALALLGALALAWVLPTETLHASHMGVRAALVGTVAFLPIVCANVLFARLFREVEDGHLGLAANVLGGLFGGLAEYLSIMIGFRALLLVAGGFYALAALAALASSRSAAPPVAGRAPAGAAAG